MPVVLWVPPTSILRYKSFVFRKLGPVHVLFYHVLCTLKVRARCNGGMPWGGAAGGAYLLIGSTFDKSSIFIILADKKQIIWIGNLPDGIFVLPMLLPIMS